MTNLSWKKMIGVTLGIFALLFGSVGLTSCEIGEEEYEQEESFEEEEDD